MEIWEALLLGVLQGLTEFLPVSSTAHLTIAGRVLGLIDDADPAAWTAFLAVVQLGTLFAVVAYFRRDLAAMARGDRDARRLGMLVILGTLPIAIVGLLLRDVIEGPMTKDLRVIAGALILLGLLLGAADRWGKRTRDEATIGWRDALVVGGAQVLSLVPGASRSGMTLAGGLFAGLTREAAAKFSFLLSIPAIAASAILELPSALRVPADDLVGLGVATIAAVLSGYAAIWILMRVVRTRSLAGFVIYRIALGGAIIGAIAVGAM